MYTTYHLSTPSNNANDVVNSSAPSLNVSDSAPVVPNQTPRCDTSSCSFSDSTYTSNMSRRWSGLVPPWGVAPGCAPDSSSAWNSSPASVSHAFNLGHDMVAAWGGRPPSIGEAFTQGTLFAQRAVTHFQNQGPCFPSPVTRASVGPGPGCVSCGQAPRFTAPPTPRPVMLRLTVGLLALTCPGLHVRPHLMSVHPLGSARWALCPVLLLTQFWAFLLLHLRHLVFCSTRNRRVLQSVKFLLQHPPR